MPCDIDSGSSVHSGRAGSSPASRTTFKAQSRKILGLFCYFENFLSNFTSLPFRGLGAISHKIGTTDNSGKKLCQDGGNFFF